jgi:hypothetical protein
VGRPGSVPGLGLVESPDVAADLALSDAVGLVDGEIAGAAVRAAIGSGGGGGSAPKAAHCDGPARDRRGRGSRMHSVPSCRGSRGRNWRSTRRRDWFCSTVHRIERTGAFVVSMPGAMSGAGWALPAVRFCGPWNHRRQSAFRQTTHSAGAAAERFPTLNERSGRAAWPGDIMRTQRGALRRDRS